jgi:eukaryotic-like serine/threonine-protein kinase
MDRRWEQIERIFHEASEFDAAARSAFLDQACAGDTGLRAEVESLLDADGHGARVFGEALGRVVESMPDDESMEGRTVGPYTIEREIGRGGMGAVYLAHRKDDFSKRVAIKLVKRGMDTEQIVRRFHRERQILANLEHANIARLLDGGAAEDGRPYLVMEYVEGKPLTQYCADAGLSVRAKLALFLQVCEGVLCAHRNLAIHRDLKPGNILVNADGVVKLLDFGIAKLLDPNAEGETAQRTMIGAGLLTPDYASPEQVRGAAVSVSTDVYSLGAVLYELLCGRPPHRFAVLSAWEIERVICEGNVAPMGIGSRELECIVAMALRKEPERRYPSVEQLADDVRRYLDGRPVLAVPDSKMYRAGRWVKRHRTAAIAAGVAIVGLLSGLGVALYQARVAREHAARAERRFGQVRKLAKAILFEHYDQIRELPGATKAKQSMAQLSQEYLNSLASEVDDPQLLLELAIAYRRLAEVQGAPGTSNLGQFPQAVGNFRKSVELLDRLPAREWQRKEVLEAAVNSLWRLSRALQNAGGGKDEAQAAVRRQADLAERLYRLQPGDVESTFLYVNASIALSTDALLRGDIDGAAGYAQNSVRIAEQVVKDTSHRRLLAAKATSYRILADAVWNQGDLQQARRLFERYVDLFADLAKKYPLEQYYANSLYFGHYRLGKLHASFHRLHLGDAGRAEKHCREYLGFARRMHQADPADSYARQNLGHGSLCAGIAVALRNPREALGLLRDAVHYTRDEMKRGTSQVTRVNAAFTWMVLGDTEAAAGLRTAALDSFGQAMRLYDALEEDKLSAEDRTDLMLANRQYALLLRDADRARKAVRLTRLNGKLQDLVHAAEARQTLAEVSPADRCLALREAAALWEKVRAHPVAAELGARRLQAIRASACAKP